MRPVPCPLPQLTFSVLMLVVISCTPDAAVEQQQGNPQSPQDNGETGGQDTAQNPEGTVRSLRIVTELSPSWVAWSEVEVWGSWDQEGGEVVNLTGDLQAWSSSQGSDAPYQAVDGNPDTSWNSGDFAPATLVLDLPRPAVISEVRLRVTQSPAGPTRHLLQAASSDKNYGTLTVFEDETFSGEWLVYRAPVGDIEDCPALEFSLIMEQTTQPCSDCFIWFWGMGVPEQRPRLEVDYTTETGSRTVQFQAGIPGMDGDLWAARILAENPWWGPGACDPTNEACRADFLHHFQARGTVDGAPLWHGILFSDLSVIPCDATITRAYLHLHINEAEGLANSDHTSVVAIHRGHAWDPVSVDGLRYGTDPNTGEALTWSTPGGDFGDFVMELQAQRDFWDRGFNKSNPKAWFDLTQHVDSLQGERQDR